MNYPIISIIVPIYKVEQYLHQCIDSILHQTFSNFELLLIDDGSPDKSGAICDEYALKDSRIRVFHKINGGVSSARNIGLDNAQGEWIYFVDPDDILFDDCLEVLFSKTSSNYDCINAGYIETDWKTKEPIITKVIETVIDYKKALLDFYKSKYFQFNGYLWNRLFRHSVIEKYRLRFHEDIYYKEDGLFLVEFICKSQKDVFITTKPVYKYYLNPQGAMKSLLLQFNVKYLTNMDARILCWENIKNVTEWFDFKLRFEAKRSIVQLYYIVLYQLKYHNIKDKKISYDLYNKMIHYVSMPYFYRIYDIKAIVTNKLKSFILCVRKK